MTKISSQAPENEHHDISLLIKSQALYDDEHFSDGKIAEGTRLVEAEFSGCVFKNCKFFEATFFDCTFENCRFDNCDLASISIKHSSFQQVNFVDCKLTGIQWNEAAVPLDVHFKKCLLNYSGFVGVDLRKSDIVECQLKEVDFTEANLSRANCNYSDFAGARFVQTNLSYTDLTAATNYAIHPDGNILKKTKFSLPEALSLLDVYDIVIK